MTNRAFILPSQTAVISEPDIERARDIRDAVVATVESRRAYVERNGVDPAFAYPDGIWSQEDGEVLVVEHYRALYRLDRKSLARMRGTVPFFTGHVLYEVCRGNEYRALLSRGVERRPFPSYTDEEVLENLVARNGAYVDRWEHITRGLPVRCLYAPPHRFGEIGELRRGIIVNHDTVAYQERIGLIHDTGLLQWLDEVSARQGGLRVLEIGGGYGALAYWFKSAFRNCSYTIIDLPECLLSSALCLGLSLPDQRVSVGRLDDLPMGLRFVPNYMAHAVDEQFDLVINTLSLSEMGVPQIRAYAELIARHWIANGGLFFEQNQDNRKIGLVEDLPKVLADYFPYRVIEQQPRDVIKGTPHIWARRQIRLYPHERTEPLA
jgi:hypothetical protein